MRWLWKFLIFVVGAGLLALFIAVMLMVAYPKSLEVGAPYLCPDDMADSFVVRYNVQTSDGEGTNFTLFCMSERGEVEEVGTWEPLLVLFAIVSALVYGLLILWRASRLIRGIGRRGNDPPAGPTDPLVMTSDQILGQPAGEDPFKAIRDQEGPIID